MWSQFATTLFIGHYRLFRTFYRTFWSFRTIYRSFFVLSDNIMQLIQIISEKPNFFPIYYRKFKKSIIFAPAKNAYYYMHSSFQEEPTVMFAPRFLFISLKRLYLLNHYLCLKLICHFSETFPIRFKDVWIIPNFLKVF